MSQKKSFTVDAKTAGWRADRALRSLVGESNRRAIKTLFHDKRVALNGKHASGSERVYTGDVFELSAQALQSAEQPPEKKAPRLTTAHGRHLLRLHEDADVLVISKPTEIPVHRGQGGYTRRDTLEDVLERAYPAPPFDPNYKPTRFPRQGYYFVHRLDMETSGCLLIAKHEAARDALIRDFAHRKIGKDYLAVVVGEPEWETITCTRPIAYVRAGEDDIAAMKPGGERARRNPFHSTKRHTAGIMRGLKKGIALEEGSVEGKSAETRFKVIARYRGYTLLRARPKSGRTHQIRVHLTALGHALAYDPLYGRRAPLRYREFDLHAGETERGDEVVLNRLPLHAWKLAFTHPGSGDVMKVEAALPRDLKEFLRLLKKFR